ncbi:hypothetical protein [Salinicoccus albus]|uniref:hypothetical protein n=1 Tax=Salinicoccus albus TaxID=418756 RepID=UPI00039F99AF|nr:hypothetical protein [Salinicoccus albus]
MRRWLFTSLMAMFMLILSGCVPGMGNDEDEGDQQQTIDDTPQQQNGQNSEGTEEE